MRRRRTRHHRVIMMAGLPAVAGAWAWQQAGQAGHVAGAVAFIALGVLVVPPLLTSAVLAPGVLVQLLVPRSRRIAQRHGQHDRPPVPARLRRAVLCADRGRCVARRLGGCSGGIELDHLRPWAAGGLSTLFNFFGLCQRHNRVKSNYWVADDGYVSYRPFPGCDDRLTAALIAAAERRARWNVLRWWRAAWSLA